MDGCKNTGVWESAQGSPGAAEEKLDRALVAGLMLEVILETAGSPLDPQTQRRLVKTRLKDTLVTHLAGRVTLDRFRRLLRQLDHWFPVYYPLITAGPPPGLPPALRPDRMATSTGVSLHPCPSAMREDRLQAWFGEEGRELLPRRPHRKLSQDKLWDFLGRTRGAWFRLKDFERHFGVDRKTAWEYLQKLLAAGLLRHNRRRSAAVRYGLAPRFLRVRADALESAVRQALSGMPASLAGKVSGWLLVRGGEPFWEDELHTLLSFSWRRRLITRLQAASILEEISRLDSRRRLRLVRRWLEN